MTPRPLLVRNAEAADIAEMPVLDFDGFRQILEEEISKGARLSSLFARPEGPGKHKLFAVLSQDAAGSFMLLSSIVGKNYPALTPDCPQAHLFEREIAENGGPEPWGHPWLKPVRNVFDASSAAGKSKFFKVEGAEIHEVAVGPVHAGIIEPGHFRFQCHGENVLHLEIALGYQHRGVERPLAQGPHKRTLPIMETLAGDTSVGHASAYCQALEGLSRARVPLRGFAVRAIGLELERLANHTGDLGALANDVGFLPTASFCGRLRGDFLNVTAALCGNRFGRGLVIPGGTAYDIEEAKTESFLGKIKKTFLDLENAVKLLWESPSVMSRFEDTGKLSTRQALELGAVGPAARASDVKHDVRYDFPTGFYQLDQIPMAGWETGDVFARALVRWLEIQRSVEFIVRSLKAMPKGLCVKPAGELERNKIIVSLIEGWRGEICHVAATDREGKFAFYKITDPSFHNWTALEVAMRGQPISDFPLCNKSFNLSYCGHDL